MSPSASKYNNINNTNDDNNECLIDLLNWLFTVKVTKLIVHFVKNTYKSQRISLKIT